MDGPLTSKFASSYRVRFVAVPIIMALINVLFIHGYLYSNTYVGHLRLLTTIIICLIAVAIYVLFLVITYKIITVTNDYILVKNVFVGNQLKALYTDMKNVGTYRANEIFRGRSNGILNQQLYIELKDGKSININGGQYENYDQLKWAIYDNFALRDLK